jgi:large subunit ribosomal protein L9
MKVLLCQDVDSLGFIGDVVDVKNGYARNYLLPQGIATVPTEGNIRSLAEAKAKAASERQARFDNLKRLCEEVEGAEVSIEAKANEQGHLFGSVTEKNIAEKLQEQGFAVQPEMVKLGEHIKDIGGHSVTIRMAAELEAKVTVTVVSQDEIVESTETENQQEEQGEEQQ